MTQVRLALPKGSLEKKTRAFLEAAGIEPKGYGDGSRSYRPDLGIPGLDVKIMRPQEIPYMIAAGFFDLGLSGLDWYLETACQANVEDMLDLGFGRVDIVLATPNEWDDVNNSNELFQKFADSTGTRPLRIWTEYLNLTENLIRQHNEQLTRVSVKYREDLESQQQLYLDQIRSCRDEIQRLKAALRNEEQRSRRLQQLLRGDP